jgi:exonuclease SbcC
MIDFVTQSRTEAGSWNETFDITVSGGDRMGDEFKDLSGGEQVRVSIALRLALSKILMRRVGTNIKFLLLDEVDQALDRQGIQALAETLRSLSSKFKIMVITHNDSMKDMFDHIVTVRKGAAGSTVRQAAA